VSILLIRSPTEPGTRTASLLRRRVNSEPRPRFAKPRLLPPVKPRFLPTSTTEYLLSPAPSRYLDIAS